MENTMLEIKKKKNRKRKRKFQIILFSIFSIFIYNIISHLEFNDHININKSQINTYIIACDKASIGKLQINWKQLAAVDAVIYKNNLSEATSESISKLASSFIEEYSTSSKDSNCQYTLIHLDKILEKLHFHEKQKEKAYKYLEDLKYVGLVKSNLKEDSYCRKFINELSSKTVEIYYKYDILPSIIISQAILESGWGKSELSVKSNNLFGIKADSSWKGEIVTMKTSEYHDTTIEDNFRAYKNKGESLGDYVKFLCENKRYREHGFFNISTYTEQAQALENAGYSTVEDKDGNKTYADLLIKIIRQNNLQLIDYDAQMKKYRDDCLHGEIKKFH